MKNEFLTIFQVSKTINFSVDYYTLSSNKNPHFTTTAEEFNRPKTDYNRCGQCQDSVLPVQSEVYSFYKKWDRKHLQDLSETEYKELIEDIELLKGKYNYIYKKLNKEQKPYNPNISFYQSKELSMMKLPNGKNKPKEL